MAASPVFRIAVEGNIGAGKSTFLSELHKKLEEVLPRDREIIMHPEDVSRWMADDLLSPMYTQKTSSACVAFQALGPHVDFLQRLQKNRMRAPCISVEERHFLTTLDVFSPLSADPTYGAAQTTPVHAHAFERLMYATDAAVGGDLSRPADIMLYLHTPAEECMRRLRKRARQGESVILIEDLRALERKHDTFYELYQPLITKFRLNTLDADGSCLTPPALAEEAAALVAHFAPAPAPAPAPATT